MRFTLYIVESNIYNESKFVWYRVESHFSLFPDFEYVLDNKRHGRGKSTLHNFISKVGKTNISIREIETREFNNMVELFNRIDELREEYSAYLSFKRPFTGYKTCEHILDPTKCNQCLRGCPHYDNKKHCPKCNNVDDCLYFIEDFPQHKEIISRYTIN